MKTDERGSDIPEPEPASYAATMRRYIERIMTAAEEGNLPFVEAQTVCLERLAERADETEAKLTAERDEAKAENARIIAGCKVVQLQLKSVMDVINAETPDA